MNNNAATRKMNILIVDDENSIRVTLSEFLKDEGYFVEVSEDADQALKILSKQEFDIVLTDIIMPRTTGVSLLKAIKETFPDVQVILMTGEPTVETASAAVRSNAYDYLTKPIVKENLLKTVANAVSFKRINDERNRLQEDNQNYQKNLEKLVDERTEALQESEKFQKTIFETTALPTGIIEEDTTISSVNKAFEKVSGYSKEEIEGKRSWTEFVGEDDLKRMKKYHQQRRIDTDSAPKQYEFKFINKNGGIRDILLNVSLIPGTKKSAASFLDITERKQAEQLLLVNEKRYKKAQSMGHAGNWEYDVITEKFWGSEEAKRIYGFAQDQDTFSTENVEGCIPERERVHQALIDLIENDKEYDLVFDIITFDKGIRKTIHSIAEAERDAEGNVIKVTGVFSDITEQKRAEDEISSKLDLLRIAGESAKFGGWSVDLVSNTQIWSDAVSDIHETPRGHNPPISEGINYYAPEWRDKITEVFNNCVNNGVPYDEEMQIITKTGKLKWVRTIGEAVKNNDGKVIKVQGSFQDINDRKELELALREEQRTAQKYLDVAEVMLVALNPKGEVSLINPHGCKVLGYSEDEIVGQNWFEKVVPADEIKQRELRYFKDLKNKSKKAQHSESIVVTKNGERKIIEFKDSIIWDENSEVIGALSSGTDITHRKQTEDAIKIMSAAQAKIAEQNDLQDIYQIVGESISKIIPNAIVFTTLFDESLQAMKIISMHGISTRNEKFLKILNIDISKSVFPIKDMPDSHLKAYQSGRLERYPGDLYALLMKKAPKKFCEVAQKQFGLDEINVIGFVWKDKDFGGVTILSRTGINPFSNMIETIMNQASITIMRIVTATDLEISRKELFESLDGAIKLAASMVEKRDPYTAGHQLRVAHLAVAIAAKMGLSEEKIEGIHYAGLIHDLGKINIPAEILSKPGKLTAIEFDLIKTHPQSGYDLLKNIDFPWPISDIVAQHHEKMNGSGYPKGLSGNDIILEARIMCVADIVEAMSSHRPYRPALGLEKAFDQINKDRGTLLDPDVVDACLRVFDLGYQFV